jgi:hypothetical protein
MAVFTLRTLVLRGAAVVRDGRNVGLRLGAEFQTACPTPEVRINPRHPSHNCRPGFMAGLRPDCQADYDRVAVQAAEGAGRSLRSDGVLSRRGAARIAAPAIPLGWCKPQGTPMSDAKRWSPKGKQTVVGNAASLAQRPAWHLPAGRTRTASTWAS